MQFNTPTQWENESRRRAKNMAALSQSKLSNKRLVKVDDRTWVYVSDGEEARKPKKYDYRDNPDDRIMNKCKILHDGKEYSTLTAVALHLGIKLYALSKDKEKYGVKVVRC